MLKAAVFRAKMDNPTIILIIQRLPHNPTITPFFIARDEKINGRRVSAFLLRFCIKTPKKARLYAVFRRLCKKSGRIKRPLIVVAEVGFEPHDLRVMSPTSYQAALLRDILFSRVVPVTGIEPVRYSRITGF